MKKEHVDALLARLTVQDESQKNLNEFIEQQKNHKDMLAQHIALSTEPIRSPTRSTMAPRLSWSVKNLLQRSQTAHTALDSTSSLRDAALERWTCLSTASETGTDERANETKV